MNKNEFIDVLEKSLIRLPKADRDDILSDYEAHFAIGLENGKTEEEVSASLGDPHELAQTYLENLPEGAKGAPAASAEAEEPEAQPQPEVPVYDAPSYGAPKPQAASAPAKSAKKTSGSGSPDAGSVVLVVFLSIVAFFALLSIIGAWFALPGTAFGCLVGCIALVAAGVMLMPLSVLAGIGALLLSIGVLAFGVLAVFGAIASAKGIIWLVKEFIKFCQNQLEGGNN